MDDVVQPEKIYRVTERQLVLLLEKAWWSGFKSTDEGHNGQCCVDDFGKVVSEAHKSIDDIAAAGLKNNDHSDVELSFRLTGKPTCMVCGFTQENCQCSA